MTDHNDMTAIERIRHLANVSGDVRESLWDDLTRDQIFAIFDAWMASGWDFYPDQWTERQLQDALAGIVPQWDNNEEPIYPPEPTRVLNERAKRIASKAIDILRRTATIAFNDIDSLDPEHVEAMHINAANNIGHAVDELLRELQEVEKP